MKKHVTCKLTSGRYLEIWRGGKLIGAVDNEKDDDPIITLYGNLSDYNQTLSFNDLEIIMDNWAQLLIEGKII